jgi:hypothetical protein
MQIKKLLLSTVMGLGLASAIASVAVAAPVAVRDAVGGDGVFASAGLHQSVSISTNGGTSFGSQGAGAFGLEIATDPGLSIFNSFVTYCFEIGQNLFLPTTYESQALATALANNVPAPAPTAAAAAEKIQRLWAARFADSVNEGGGTFDGVVGATSQERAAAFQVAIWELSVDNGDGLNSGSFRLGAGQTNVEALANIYLGLASGAGATANVLGLYHPTIQNLLYAPPGGPGGADVPAPASLALFGAGLVALAAMRRRKNA